MPPRRLLRCALLVLAASIVLLAGCTTSGDGGAPPTSPSGPEASPSPRAEPSPGPGILAFRRSFEIELPSGGSLRVHGLYPAVGSRCVDVERPRLEARYPGTLVVERTQAGRLSLAVRLSFGSYLEGIAEVPPTWPRAALEAQAIAARSYALATTGWDGAQGETLDTPICSTTACQVYRGIPVPRQPAIRRWYRAVRRTAGLVLLYQGRPATTVYFSTSNGHTYGNEDVFGSAPLPYLRPVVERHDGASPTSRWRVSLPLRDLARFLRHAGEWPGGRSISRVRFDGSTVIASGAGRSRAMDLSTFRDAVNLWAPCLEPSHYPTGRLPSTIPSRWLSMSSSRHAVVVTGRGWGHGAGMVQWGAYGKARHGYSAARILAAYYGGLRPRRFPEPGLITVNVTTGLSKLRVRIPGVGAEIDGQPVAAGWLSISGGDSLTVTPS